MFHTNIPIYSSPHLLNCCLTRIHQFLYLLFPWELAHLNLLWFTRSSSINLNQNQWFITYSHCLEYVFFRGWSGGAKVSCILHHRGVQLMLAYRWARLAILVAGKGRGGMFFISSVSSFSFLLLFLPCPSLSALLLLFSPFLWEMTQNDPKGLTCH